VKLYFVQRINWSTILGLFEGCWLTAWHGVSRSFCSLPCPLLHYHPAVFAWL